MGFQDNDDKSNVENNGEGCLPWLLAYTQRYTGKHIHMYTLPHIHIYIHKEHRKEEFHKVTSRAHQFTERFSINNMAEGLAYISSPSTYTELRMGHCYSSMLLWNSERRSTLLRVSHMADWCGAGTEARLTPGFLSM